MPDDVTAMDVAEAIARRLAYERPELILQYF